MIVLKSPVVRKTLFIGPGNRSPIDTNVVVVVVVVVVVMRFLLLDFQSTKTFPFRKRS